MPITGGEQNLALWVLQLAFGVAVFIATRSSGSIPAGERMLRLSVLVAGLIPLAGGSLLVQLPLALVLILARALRLSRARRALERLQQQRPLSSDRLDDAIPADQSHRDPYTSGSALPSADNPFA